MKIAIIGGGNVGQALGSSFVKAGHQVTVFDRDYEDAAQLCSSIGGTAARSLEEAVGPAEVVVLAVPFAASAEEVSRQIGDKGKGKVIIDATNKLKPDYSDLLDRN